MEIYFDKKCVGGNAQTKLGSGVSNPLGGLSICAGIPAHDFDAVYCDMLEQFPKAEIKPKDAYLKLMGGGKYEFGIVRNNAGKMLAYFLCYRVKKQEIGLLDHFAVVKEMHGSGIGTVLLSALKDYYSDLRGLLLELEQPNPADSATLRRIRFYKRAGAYLLDIKYLLPAAGSAYVPMDLFFLNCGFSGRIPDEDVKCALRDIFENVHSCFENIEGVWEILKKSWSNGPQS